MFTRQVTLSLFTIVMMSILVITVLEQRRRMNSHEGYIDPSYQVIQIRSNINRNINNIRQTVVKNTMKILVDHSTDPTNIATIVFQMNEQDLDDREKIFRDMYNDLGYHNVALILQRFIVPTAECLTRTFEGVSALVDDVARLYSTTHRSEFSSVYPRMAATSLAHDTLEDINIFSFITDNPEEIAADESHRKDWSDRRESLFEDMIDDVIGQLYMFMGILFTGDETRLHRLPVSTMGQEDPTSPIPGGDGVLTLSQEQQKRLTASMRINLVLETIARRLNVFVVNSEPLNQQAPIPLAMMLNVEMGRYGVGAWKLYVGLDTTEYMGNRFIPMLLSLLIRGPSAFRDLRGIIANPDNQDARSLFSQDLNNFINGRGILRCMLDQMQHIYWLSIKKLQVKEIVDNIILQRLFDRFQVTSGDDRELSLLNAYFGNSHTVHHDRETYIINLRSIIYTIAGLRRTLETAISETVDLIFSFSALPQTHLVNGVLVQAIIPLTYPTDYVTHLTLIFAVYNDDLSGVIDRYINSLLVQLSRELPALVPSYIHQQR